MDKLEIDKKINEENKRLFKRYDIQRPNKKRYKCCICKENVSISGSFSNQGDRLICSKCACKIFNWNIRKLMKWVNKEDEI